MENILKNHEAGVRFVLMLLLFSIMLCFFYECWDRKEVKAESAFSSSEDDEEEESEMGENIKNNVSNFVSNHAFITTILVIIFTVINWKIWNHIVDVEFFSSIADHYIRKAFTCGLIGVFETGILILILSFLWEIIKKILLFCLIIIGIIGLIAIIYKIWGYIKEVTGGLPDKKENFQIDIIPEKQGNATKATQGENFVGSKIELVAAGEKPMAKCKNCGEKIEIDAKFCCFCGTKLY